MVKIGLVNASVSVRITDQNCQGGSCTTSICRRRNFARWSKSYRINVVNRFLCLLFASPFTGDSSLPRFPGLSSWFWKRGYAEGEGWASWGRGASSAGAGPKRRRCPSGTTLKKMKEVSHKYWAMNLPSLVPVIWRVAGFHISCIIQEKSWVDRRRRW